MERIGSNGTAVVIVAAGRGTRASKSGDVPKQYALLAGRPVLARTIAAFLDCGGVGPILVVIHPDDVALYENAIAALDEEPIACGRLRPFVFGGATRQASVLAGLEALAGHTDGPPEGVLIHDAARPFVTAATIQKIVAGLAATAGAIAAEPLADTLKREGGGGLVKETVPRAGLWRAQTPQGFRFRAIIDAHRRAALEGLVDFTDDAAIAEWAGLDVRLVAGSPDNTKLTTAEDIAVAERKLISAEQPGGYGNMDETRTGTGFDVHRFGEGDHVWLCGLKIPHDKKLDGHSDADVGLHALTDALLGAIGDGDIGMHFPPSDPKWKGASSDQFLADAVRRVSALAGRIVNVDVTLLCEEPKVGPHRDAMRTRLAEILGIDVSRVGVKATTTEGLGFTGRREGIAAMASASVIVPS